MRRSKARREYTERIRAFSNDVKERTSSVTDTAKEKISSSVSRGQDFLDEKRSVFSSAVGAGKKAHARARAQVPSDR